MKYSAWKKTVSSFVALSISASPLASLQAFADEPIVDPGLTSFADPVLYWNAVMLRAEAEDKSGTYGTADQAGPTKTARALGIIQAAVYDAVNSIDRSHEPYHTLVAVESGTPSMDAAVAYSAYTTLVGMYPKQKTAFDGDLADHLAVIPDGESKDLGKILGRTVALQILKDRENDGSNADMNYTPSDQPGKHRVDPLNPTQPFLSPKWGNVAPFIMESSSQFRAPAPPDMTSQEYADAYNEVKTLGSDGIITPTTRTEEETNIGLYWAYDGTKHLGTPPRMYNQITRLISLEKGNSVVDNARLLAQINLAQADAGISAWETKYYYNFWRPVIAIRESDGETGPTGLGDGNADTVGDPTWTPLGAPASNQSGTDFTPPFPAYVSGHATFASAALHTVALFYGTDNIPFTFTSDELNGVTTDKDGVARALAPRSFTTMTQAIEENAQSRIYLGIHWKFDAEQGIAMGTSIADYDFAHSMQAVTEDLDTCESASGSGKIVVLDSGIVFHCISGESYDLTPSMTAPASVQRGSTFATSLSVRNDGPGQADNASVAIQLPAGISVNHVVSGSCSTSGSSLVCDDFDIASGSTISAEVEFNVAADHACPSSISFTPVASASDDSEYFTPNNTGSAKTVGIDCEPQNDITAALTSPTQVAPGNVIYLNATIGNNGGATASAPVLTIPVVTGVTFLADQSPSCALDSAVVRCTGSAIAPNGSDQFTVAFQPLSTLPCGTAFAFQATASSSETELDASNNASALIGVYIACNESNGGSGDGSPAATIDQIRERNRDTDGNDEVHASSGRGNGASESMTAFALLCSMNGIDMPGHQFTGYYKAHGKKSLVASSNVKSDSDIVIGGFTVAERKVLCGMKKFMNQDKILYRQTEEYRTWLMEYMASMMHKTTDDIVQVLADPMLCH